MSSRDKQNGTINNETGKNKQANKTNSRHFGKMMLSHTAPVLCINMCLDVHFS